jgi:predicted nucleic acid-binding protein
LTRLLVDTSVLIKWFHSEGEAELAEARTLRAAHLAGDVMTAEWLRDAASMAHDHRLSFYDAAWAASANGLGIPLVSADRQLLSAGLAETATDVVRRLGLSPP